MKKFFTYLLFVISISVYSQSEIPVARLHYINVEGNIGNFIDAQKNYFKAIALDAVKNEKWVGWACMQSVENPNQFLFVHHFKSLKQLEEFNPNQVFSTQNAKSLGLWQPDWNSFISNGFIKPQIIFQKIEGINDGRSEFFYVNMFRFNDRQKFIGNNSLYGKEVIKPQTKTSVNNWGYGVVLSNQNWISGEAKSYNGISFDGFRTLESALNAAAYNANSTTNKYNQNFSKKAQENELTNAYHEINRTLWRVVDDSWKE